MECALDAVIVSPGYLLKIGSRPVRSFLIKSDPSISLRLLRFRYRNSFSPRYFHFLLCFSISFSLTTLAGPKGLLDSENTKTSLYGKLPLLSHYGSFVFFK